MGSLTLTRHQVAALVLDGHHGLAGVDGCGLVHVDADPDAGWATLAAEPDETLDALADLLTVLLGAELVVEVVRDESDLRAADVFAAADGRAVAVLAGPPDAGVRPGGGDPPVAVTLVEVAPVTIPALVRAAAGWDEDGDDPDGEGPVARLTMDEVAAIGELATVDRSRALTRLRRAGLDRATARQLAAGLAGPCRAVTVRARRGTWVGEVSAFDDAHGRRWSVGLDRDDDGTPLVLVGRGDGLGSALEALLWPG
ncbi:MAG TPA: hypothetical protein VF244_04590 [Acidimicrobiales bacterium]